MFRVLFYHGEYLVRAGFRFFPLRVLVDWGFHVEDQGASLMDKTTLAFLVAVGLALCIIKVKEWFDGLEEDFNREGIV